MGKLIVTEFVSVDGVMEDPGGSENFEHGGWALTNPDPEQGRFKMQEIFDAESQLLGRVTYDGFAEAWPGREDGAGFADRMNSMKKYVVSTTVTDPSWENTEVIADNVVEKINELRAAEGGSILVAGSQQLVAFLLNNDLVDELRLMVFPVVLGSGKRIFEGVNKVDLKLAESKAFGSGTTVQIYTR